MSIPNCLLFEECVDREIHATSAFVAVRIQGKSFFTGNEVLKKAAEVKQFLADLAECGLSEEDVTIEGVTTDVSSGVLGKSSAAAYVLRVRCESVERLGPVLCVAGSQKNAQVIAIDWRYAELEKLRGELLDECAVKAKQQAMRIATALGVRVVGVRKFAHKFTDPQRFQRLEATVIGAYTGRERRLEAEDPLRSLNLSHRTRLTVEVSAEFLVDNPE